jgi:metallo-beta-lactamase superfamily protein
MSEYRIEQAAPGVHALALWDEDWNSFNNCYLLHDGHSVILIDSGKAKHAAALARALRELGLDHPDIKAIVVTHGHHDHIGGALAADFANVPKHIHAGDEGLLPDADRSTWRADLPDAGDVLGLECMLLGQHTLGSVALFHRPSRALFWGDHLCFFGAQLDEDGLVCGGASTRERVLRNLAWRRAHWPPDDAEQERLRADLARRAPEDQQRYNFPLAVQGIKRAIDAFTGIEVLCTGHGTVLRGGVKGFLDQIVEENQHGASGSLAGEQNAFPQ